MHGAHHICDGSTIRVYGLDHPPHPHARGIQECAGPRGARSGGVLRHGGFDPHLSRLVLCSRSYRRTGAETRDARMSPMWSADHVRGYPNSILTPVPAITVMANDAARASRLTLGSDRALFHICAGSARGAVRLCGIGSSGRTGFQRNRPAGRRLRRPARAAVQAPSARPGPQPGAPQEEGDRTARTGTQRVTGTSRKRDTI